MQKNLHVLPKDDKWAVKKEGSIRALKLVKTQREAIAIAKRKAKESRSELLIHGKNGEIREKNSYGNDHFPPKG